MSAPAAAAAPFAKVDADAPASVPRTSFSPAPPIPGGSLPFAASSVAAPIVHFDPNAADSDDDDDDEDRPKKKRKAGDAVAGGSKGEGNGSGDGEEKDKARRKIEIEYITRKEKRHISFSKRKAGIMKKAYELATLTGTQVLLLVVSETGIVYTFTTAKFQRMVGAGPNGNPSEGQRLIQACLALDPNENSDYISPPPDGPLLPLPPSAINRPFETNSAIHGGQIALRTRAHRPGAGRGGKPRPAAIRTQGGPPVATALPTPAIDPTSQPQPSPGMHVLQSPHRDYGTIPSVLQGSPGIRDPMQSSQDYTDMMNGPPMSGGYGPPISGAPYSANSMEYALPPHPHSSPGHPRHPPHSPERFHNSPVQGHSTMQQQQAQHLQRYGDPNNQHMRHYAEDSNMRGHDGSPTQMHYTPQQMQQHHQQQQQPQYHSQFAQQEEYLLQQGGRR